MRRFQYFLLVILLVFGGFAVFKHYNTAGEIHIFVVQKEIPYPLEKVYPQFSNFQNFTRWNRYFSDEKNLGIDYFQPYEGVESSIYFKTDKGKRNGEMYIRAEKPYELLKYELFDTNTSKPYLITVRFIETPSGNTKIVWRIRTPKRTLIEKYSDFWEDKTSIIYLDKSLNNLTDILANKVDRDRQINTIKYDSIIVEQGKEGVLLGINSGAKNKKEELFPSIVKDYNKVYNFVTTDLEKREDEVGFPVLISSADNFNQKEVSYYLGIPVSQKVEVNDNNFSFRNMKDEKLYSIFYKGKYENRKPSIDKLLQKAKMDNLRHGNIMETFISHPEEDKDVMIKFSIPVFR